MTPDLIDHILKNNQREILRRLVPHQFRVVLFITNSSRVNLEAKSKFQKFVATLVVGADQTQNLSFSPTFRFSKIRCENGQICKKWVNLRKWVLRTC